VAVIEDLHKSYGITRDLRDLVSRLSAGGERWAVMGRNGAGKTTLLKMIAGASEPDAEVVSGSMMPLTIRIEQSSDCCAEYPIVEAGAQPAHFRHRVRSAPQSS